VDILATNGNVGLMAVTKEDGVHDLQPMKARAEFARALLAERNGDEAKALEHLELAIQAQAEAEAA